MNSSTVRYAARGGPPAASTRIVRVESSIGTFDAIHAVHQRHHFAAHMHEYYAIGVNEDGLSRLEYRRSRRVAGPGAIVAISAEELHTGEPMTEDGWSYRMIYPNREFIACVLGADADKLGAPILFPDGFIDDRAWAVRFAAAHALLFEPSCPMASEEILLELLHELAMKHAKHTVGAVARIGRPRQIASFAKQFLRAHYSRQVRLAELAEACGVSAFHLIRTFRDVVGIPPHAYLKQLRVGEAQAMLQRGAPVTEAVFSCGFSDQSHLTRTFKSVIGIPPGAYARAVRRSHSVG